MLYLVTRTHHLDSKQSIPHKSGERHAASFQERRDKRRKLLRSILTRIDIEFWQDATCASTKKTHSNHTITEDRFIAQPLQDSSHTNSPTTSKQIPAYIWQTWKYTPASGILERISDPQKQAGQKTPRLHPRSHHRPSGSPPTTTPIHIRSRV